MDEFEKWLNSQESYGGIIKSEAIAKYRAFKSKQAEEKPSKKEMEEANEILKPYYEKIAEVAKSTAPASLVERIKYEASLYAEMPTGTMDDVEYSHTKGIAQGLFKAAEILSRYEARTEVVLAEGKFGGVSIDGKGHGYIHMGGSNYDVNELLGKRGKLIFVEDKDNG